MRYVFVLVVLTVLAGCQRMHKETGGDTSIKNQPAYSEKLQKPDPNLPGNAQ